MVTNSSSVAEVAKKAGEVWRTVSAEDKTVSKINEECMALCPFEGCIGQI